MVHLHMSPFVSTIRFYDHPGGYEARSPYHTIVTISHLTDTAAYMSGGHGEITTESWLALLAMLKSKGFTTVQYERHGKMRTKTL